MRECATGRTRQREREERERERERKREKERERERERERLKVCGTLTHTFPHSPLNSTIRTHYSPPRVPRVVVEEEEEEEGLGDPGRLRLRQGA